MNNNEALHFKTQGLNWLATALLAVAAVWHIIAIAGDIADYEVQYIIGNALYIIALIIFAVAATKLVGNAERMLIAVGFFMLAAAGVIDFVSEIVWINEYIDYLNSWDYGGYDISWYFDGNLIAIVYFLRTTLLIAAFAVTAVLLLVKNDKIAWTLATVGEAVAILYWVFWVVWYLANGIDVFYSDNILLVLRHEFENVAILVLSIFGMMGASSFKVHPAYAPNGGFTPNGGYAPNGGFTPNGGYAPYGGFAPNMNRNPNFNPQQNYAPNYNPNPQQNYTPNYNPNPAAAPAAMRFCSRCGTKFDTSKGEFCPVCGQSCKR